MNLVLSFSFLPIYLYPPDFWKKFAFLLTRVSTERNILRRLLSFILVYFTDLRYENRVLVSPCRVVIQCHTYIICYLILFIHNSVLDNLYEILSSMLLNDWYPYLSLSFLRQFSMMSCSTIVLKIPFTWLLASSL